LVQVLTHDQKRSDPPTGFPDANFGQITAAAQQKCPAKNVRGFQPDQKNFSSPIRAMDNQSVFTCRALIGLDYYLLMTNNRSSTTKTLTFNIFR
jgi:hypothetical protein